MLESSRDAHQGGLPAAEIPDEDDEVVLLDCRRHVVDYLYFGFAKSPRVVMQEGFVPAPRLTNDNWPNIG